MSAGSVKIYVRDIPRKRAKMADLSLIRHIEAKRLLCRLRANEEFDPDSWVTQLAEVMLGTPTVVSYVAHHLEIWNNEDHEEPRFVPQQTDIYKDITECVLSHAAVYRGEVRGIEAEPSKDEESDELLTEQNVLDSLQAIRLFLRGVASGKTSSHLAETHARHLGRISLWLRETKFKRVTD